MAHIQYHHPERVSSDCELVSASTQLCVVCISILIALSKAYIVYRVCNGAGLMREYQQLQIILRNLNNAFQIFILPCVQSAAIVLGSTFLYLLIPFGYKFPTLLIMMSIATALLDALVEGIGFSVAGKVNTISKSFKRNMKRDHRVNKNKVLCRTLVSLKEMKVMFGYSNFMEVSTCLEFLNFPVNVTMNLLLTVKA